MKLGPKGWTPEKLGSLAVKTYVITGANAGAGFEATRVFLSKGAKVVMMNRIADILNIPHGTWVWLTKTDNVSSDHRGCK
jgi:NADP-dependent 3-hydroxy acid dehydrogenase YdfG